MDGLTYGQVSGAADANQRIAWLEKGSLVEGNFFPQPFTQLAKVWREMGHDGAASKVLLRREKLIRKQSRQDATISPNGDVKIAFLSLWRDSINILSLFFDILLSWLVGYGHRPFRSLGCLILLIVIAIFPAHFAWKEGSFAPNSGPVLTSAGWLGLHAKESNPAEVWSGKTEPKDWAGPDVEIAWQDIAPGRDWETFHPVAYAIDVVIPIIDIGQTGAWAPSTTRGNWGWRLWWLKGVLSVFGWIVTAFGAAAIAGIIRRD